jgi:hypothetical protein
MLHWRVPCVGVRFCGSTSTPAGNRFLEMGPRREQSGSSALRMWREVTGLVGRRGEKVDQTMAGRIRHSDLNDIDPTLQEQVVIGAAKGLSKANLRLVVAG